MDEDRIDARENDERSIDARENDDPDQSAVSSPGAGNAACIGRKGCYPNTTNDWTGDSRDPRGAPDSTPTHPSVGGQVSLMTGTSGKGEGLTLNSISKLF